MKSTKLFSFVSLYILVFLAIVFLLTITSTEARAGSCTDISSGTGNGQTYGHFMTSGTNCYRDGFSSAVYTALDTFVLNWRVGAVYPDSDPIDASTNGVKIRFSNGAASIPINYIYCPGGTITNGNGNEKIVSLADGDSCDLIAEGEAGASGENIRYEATLGRSSDYYTGINASFSEVPSNSAEIDIKGNSQRIYSGDSSPSTSDYTDFGSVDITSGTASNSFSITNMGVATLTLSGSPAVSISGTHASDFSVTSQPSSSLAAAGGSSSFTIQFDPSGLGTRSATVSIDNNDPDEDPFTFSIQGTGTGIPEMAVSGNSIEIASGDSSPTTTDDTDFGSQEYTSGSVSKTFTITNSGTGNLTLSGSPAVTLSGTHASDFSFTSQPSSTIAASGGTSDFTVSFDPSAIGTRTATISIANDDNDENPYTFVIQGSGAGLPEIDVTGNSVSIANGDTSPSTADDTDFGSVDITSGSEAHTFTISNSGSGDLNLTGSPYVTLSGDHASDFSVTAQPSTPVSGSGGTTTFEITFDPSASGTRNATVTIDNDDSDESSYSFSISGDGDTYTDISAQRSGNSIAKAGTDEITSTIEALNENTLSYTIVNAGNGDWTARVSVGGEDNAVINSLSTYNITVPANSSQTLSINYVAAQAGSFGFKVNFSTSLISEAFWFAVSGTASENEAQIVAFTQQAIHNFNVARMTSITAQGPDIQGMLTDQFLGTGLFGTGGPINLTLSPNKGNRHLSFSTSLHQFLKLSDTPGYGVMTGNVFSEDATQALDPELPRFNIWTQGRWSDSTQSGDDFDISNEFSVVYFGADYRFSEDLLIGLMGQLDWNDQNSVQQRTTAEAITDSEGGAYLEYTEVSQQVRAKGKGWMLGPYLVTRLKEDLLFDLRLGWGKAKNEISPYDTYWDNYSSKRWQVESNLTGSFDYENWHLAPSVGVNYYHETQKSYVDSNGFEIPEQSFGQGNLNFGPMATYTGNYDEDTVIQPIIKLRGIWTFESPDMKGPSGATSTIEGLRGQAKLGIKIRKKNGVSWRASITHDGIGMHNYRSTSAELSVRIPFKSSTDEEATLEARYGFNPAQGDDQHSALITLRIPFD